MEPPRSGRTLVPGAAVTGETAATGADPGPSAGLDKMLEVVVSAPEPAGPQAFLLVISGADPGRLHALDRPEMVIGRSKYADVRISERAMSQQHAKVVRIGENHRVYDLGSTNGTFVNDQRVEQADLRIGDALRTGETIFTYMASGHDGTTMDSTLALPAAQQHLDTGDGPGLPPDARRNRYSAPRARAPGARVVQTSQDDNTDLLTLLVRVMVFFRRYWLSISVLALLGVALGVASYQFLKPPALAEFEIQLISTATDNPMENGRRMNFEFFRSAKQNFVRPDLIRQTLIELGEGDVAPTRVRSVQRKLNLNQTRGNPSLHSGSYEAASAENAIEFLLSHLRNYLNSEIEKTLKGLISEVDTLDRTLKEAETRLNATERKLKDFKETHLDTLPQRERVLVDRRTSLRDERDRSMNEFETAKANFELADRHVKARVPLVQSHVDAAAPYERQISDIETRLAVAAAAGKGALHPDVVKDTAELKNARQLRDDVVAKGTISLADDKNPAMEADRRALGDARAAYRAATSRLARVKRDLRKAEELGDKLPGVEQQWRHLNRSYEADQAQRNAVYKQLNSSRLRLQMEREAASGRYDVISPPDVEPHSALQTMLARGMAAGIIGLLLGIGLGLFRDLRRMVSVRLAQVRR